MLLHKIINMKKILFVLLLIPTLCFSQSKASFWFSLMQPASPSSSAYVAEVSTYPELQAALANTAIRQIRIITYDMLIEDTLIIIRPVSIVGLGAGVTTLRMDTSTNMNLCFYISGPNGNNVTISDLTIDGLQPTIDTATILSAAVDIVTNVNMGDQYGIYIDGAKEIRIKNMNLKNIDGYGIYSDGLGGGSSNWQPSVFVDQIYATNCYHAVAAISEYGLYNNIRSIRNVSGFTYVGGNNRITNSVFVDNVLNAYIGSGPNDGHGGFSNCSFNHAVKKAIYGNNVGVAMDFSGCDFFYSNIEAVDCWGWTFTGCTIGCSVTITNGTEHQISSSVFSAGEGGGTFSVTGGVLSLKNNFYNTGASATGINN